MENDMFERTVNTGALLSLLALLVGSCATPDDVWNKSGATSNDFNADNRHCSAQANAIENPRSGQIQATYNRCMEGKGWHLERR